LVLPALPFILHSLSLSITLSYICWLLCALSLHALLCACTHCSLAIRLASRTKSALCVKPCSACRPGRKPAMAAAGANTYSHTHTHTHTQTLT
jgi:MFS family permease